MTMTTHHSMRPARQVPRSPAPATEGPEVGVIDSVVAPVVDPEREPTPDPNEPAEPLLPSVEDVDPEEGRELAHQTYLAMSSAWVWLAGWFRRVQRDGLWQRWGFNSFTAYLRSDMPGKSQDAAEKMLRGLRYLEATELERAKPLLGVRVGEHTTGLGSGSIPAYTTVCRLSSLQVKANAGVVNRAEYENLHREAFAGEKDNMTVQQDVAKLLKGIRLLPSSSSNPDESRINALYTKLIVAADALKSLRAMARDGRMPTMEARDLLREIGLFFRAVIYVFGEETFDKLVAEARGDRKNNKSAKKRGQKVRRLTA